MTLPEHPDDVAQWPRDPLAVLGVPADVDSATLRRAYARLVRRYKPEHAPQEFRRIRDAYENLQQRIRWNNVTVDPEDSAPIEAELELGGPQPSGLEPAENHDGRRVSTEDNTESAWKRAEVGDWPQACALLREALQLNPCDEEACVSLYWLSLLQPSLASGNSAARCLMPILQRLGVRGRIGELYLRALHSDPEEARSDRCRDLLLDSRSRGRIVELARTRWRALARAGFWFHILTDLDRLHDELLDDTAAWLALQTTALELAAYSEHDSARRVVARCGGVFQNNESLALRHDHLFDRADFLLAVAQELEELAEPPFVRDVWQRNDALPLMTAIRRLAGADADDAQSPLLGIVEEWLCNPAAALANLSELHSRYPALSATLMQLLNARIDWESWPRITLRGEELRHALERVLADGRRIDDVSNTADYGRLRQQLLQFCLSEFVDVDDLIEALIEICPGVPTGQHSWAWYLRGDLALWVLVRGNLFFWSQSSPG